MAIRVSATPLSQKVRERLEPTLTAREEREIRLRFGGALIAGGLLLVGWLHDLLFPGQEEIGALILAIGAIIAAVPVFSAGLRGFLAPTPHSLVEQLVSLAVLASIAVGEYATAILVPLLIAVGHFLEERGILGARAAIEGLRKLQPQTARRRRSADVDDDVDDGEGLEEVPVAALRVGDEIVVRPGEIFPADGRVVFGSSAVDASTMTGEAIPEEVGLTSEVFAGTLNVSGLLRVVISGLGQKSAIGRILDVLRDAEQSKPPIVRLLERYAAYYLPIVLVATAAVLVFTEELDRAIAMLVVSCPCALVLASPAAMTAVLAVASRLGILVKNTRFLEVLGQVDTVVLDKTGTTTFGHLALVAHHVVSKVGEGAFASAALLCARASRHPVSRAVVEGLSGAEASKEIEGGRLPDVVTELAGKGIVARFDATEAMPPRVLRLGRLEWLRDELSVELPEELHEAAEAHAGPSVWLAEDAHLWGLLLLADRPRPEAAEALAQLGALGLKDILLVTGDRPEVAEKVAADLGIARVEAACLPEKKLQVVRELQAAGHKVLVVGDGVNDALALSHADVGVALGAMGSDVAIQSADIALMGNDLTRLATMVELGRRAQTTIYQNVAVAVFASAVMLVLAGAGVISPVVGAIIHNIGAFMVVANSARVLRAYAVEPGPIEGDVEGPLS